MQVHILPKQPHNCQNTHTLQTHTHTHTHPHITNPIKTTVQGTLQMKQSQYNQVPSVLGHPNVHGTFIPKNCTVTSLHCTTKSLHINNVSSLHITSLIYTPSSLEFPCYCPLSRQQTQTHKATELACFRFFRLSVGSG